MLEIYIANGDILKFKRHSVCAVQVLESFEELALDATKEYTAKIFFTGGWSIMVVDTKARIKAVVDAMAAF
jgi:hypothetical protein